MLDHDYIYHHGIKGMRWGIRRYQNKDGSLTKAGLAKERKEAKQLAKAEKKQEKKDAKASKNSKGEEPDPEEAKIQKGKSAVDQAIKDEEQKNANRKARAEELEIVQELIKDLDMSDPYAEDDLEMLREIEESILNGDP